ncbi:MAG: DNA-binding protein, partial [Gammaproteobacteria bacterium]
GRVSEVLNHQRGLSLNMIRNLHVNLSIPLENLISETK